MHSSINTTTSQLSSTDAATRYGLTNDHIASLCRRGKVEGHLAGGRLWFVNEDSLKAYLLRGKEERVARGRKLSKKIKEEYVASVEKPYVPSWRMPGSGYALALALFVVGTFYVSVPLATAALVDVPWAYMPAAVASVSSEAYRATFIPVAKKYLDFVDAVGDVQAQSYRTLGAAVVFIASYPVPQHSAAAAEAALPVFGGSVDEMLRRAPLLIDAVFGVTHVLLPRTGEGKLGTTPITGAERTLQFFPASLAETLVAGWTDMATWYAEGFLRSAYATSDAQVYVYETVASAELALSDGLVRGWVALVQPLAGHFINGVYAVASAQAYTEEAVLVTMSESSDTIGAAVADAMLSVGNSAEHIARWYKEGSDRVSARMIGADNAARVSGGVR